MNLASGIRNGVRAVVVRENRLLLLRKVYEDGSERFVLPGGAQDPGETLGDALQRECREEIGTEVCVRGLLYLADFFKPRTSPEGSFRQHVELLFLCQAPDHYRARNGDRPDRHQVDVVWVGRERLDEIALFPSDYRQLLASGHLEPHSVYLGTIDP